MPNFYGNGTLGFELHSPHNGSPGWELLYSHTDCLSRQCEEIGLPTSMNSSLNLSHFVEDQNDPSTSQMLPSWPYGLCTRPLRIIILPSNRVQCPHLSPFWRGQGHGLTPVLLPTRSVS